MNRTLLFGEGLFETIRWKGEEEKVRLHYQRLKSSADFFGIPCPSYELFLESIKRAVPKNRELYVKFLLLSRGKDLYYGIPSDYEVKVLVKDIPSAPSEVKLCISSAKRHSYNPIFKHKTTNFMFNVLVKREAVSRGFFDGIVLNEREYVTECSASNLIILKRDRLYTPSKESGLLWGTTLQYLINKGADIKERYLNLGDLMGADSVFVCNSLMGVIPVKAIEDRSLPVDKEVLKELKKLYI